MGKQRGHGEGSIYQRMTQQVYAHVFDERKREVAQLLDSALEQVQPKEQK